MKALRYSTLITALSLLLTGCQSAIDEQGSLLREVHITFSASAPTRSMVSDPQNSPLEYKWTSDDVIYVNDGQRFCGILTLAQGSVDSQNGQFEGTIQVTGAPDLTFFYLGTATHTLDELNAGQTSLTLKHQDGTLATLPSLLISKTEPIRFEDKASGNYNGCLQMPYSILKLDLTDLSPSGTVTVNGYSSNGYTLSAAGAFTPDADSDAMTVNVSEDGTYLVLVSGESIPLTLTGTEKYAAKTVSLQPNSYYSGTSFGTIEVAGAPNPVSFTASERQTVSLTNVGGNAPSLQYSYDKINWTNWDYSALEFGVEGKPTVYFRGMNTEGFSRKKNKYSKYAFSINASVQGSGNIMSLINYQEVVNTIPCDYCFNALFHSCSSLVSAPGLPTTTLANSCYYCMFYDCTSLVDAPALPATTLAHDCYRSMFNGCTNLMNAPALTATTLVAGCYESMFNRCSSLVTAPALPATALADSCYYSMFFNCSSLVNAPALPATTLAHDCYRSMFNRCSSLVNAPALPATTLAQDCYRLMFYGCTNLMNAPALTATTLVAGCYVGMFNGCSSLVNAPALPATTLAQDCYRLMFNGCTNLMNAPALTATTLVTGCYVGMFNGCSGLVTAPALPATALADSCYYSMFYNCSSLVNAPALPATTLAHDCYRSMFNRCTSLVNAPALPATTLVDSCYYCMFNGCSSLVNAPALPATTLAQDCYRSMFNSCTNLMTAPALPATVLADVCYGSMFHGCSSLVNAPSLPATTLAPYCYGSMFSGCSSLTDAPELPATSLVSGCYTNMFNGCSKLSYIKADFLTTPSDDYTKDWVKGVASSGDFVNNPSATWDLVGDNAIPYGWSVNGVAR